MTEATRSIRFAMLPPSTSPRATGSTGWRRPDGRRTRASRRPRSRHRDHDRGAAPEQPEGDPGVLDVVDRERPDDVDAVAELERPADDLLRELIGEDRRAGDEREDRSIAPALRRASARRTRPAGARSRSSRCGRRRRSRRSSRARSSPLSWSALVVDAKRCVRHRLQSLLPDRLAALGAACRTCRPRCGRAPPRSRRDVLGVLLEPFVELAHVRLGRAVGEVVAGSDREIPGLLEQRAVVMHRVDGAARSRPRSLSRAERKRSRSSSTVTIEVS